MNRVKWTKELLCNAMNQRVDRRTSGETIYIMPLEITDTMLEAFQGRWDMFNNNPIEQENEIMRFYQSLVGGF